MKKLPYLSTVLLGTAIAVICLVHIPVFNHDCRAGAFPGLDHAQRYRRHFPVPDLLEVVFRLQQAAS